MFKLFLVVLSVLATVSNSQDVRVENFEMSDANANSCETIVELSTFDGDCCSLNSTTADSCVLNIVNGRCKISGQFWTIDWTSTYSTGGAKCPPSEYPELASASLATEPPAAGENTEDNSSSSPSRMSVPAVMMMILSSIAAGFVAIAL